MVIPIILTDGDGSDTKIILKKYFNKEWRY